MDLPSLPTVGDLGGGGGMGGMGGPGAGLTVNLGGGGGIAPNLGGMLGLGGFDDPLLSAESLNFMSSMLPGMFSPPMGMHSPPPLMGVATAINTNGNMVQQANMMSPNRSGMQSLVAPSSGGRKKSRTDGGGGGGGGGGGNGTPVRKKPPQLDEHGQPVAAKKARKRATDPVTGESLPAPKRKRKKASESGVSGNIDEDGGAGGGGGGSGGKKKAARRRALEQSSHGVSFDAMMPPHARASAYTAHATTGSSHHSQTHAGPTYGKTRGPFHKEIMDLLSSSGGDRTPLLESACVLEEVLIEFLATLTSLFMSVPSVNLGKDALAAASLFANTADGSGVTATAIATAPPIDLDALLFVLRAHPAFHERAKEAIAHAQEQQANANANKKS